MNKILMLTFNTEDNKNYKLTIQNPKDNLEKSSINTVADKIVATEIFNNTKRVLKSLKKASYITREEHIVE